MADLSHLASDFTTSVERAERAVDNVARGFRSEIHNNWFEFVDEFDSEDYDEDHLQQFEKVANDAYAEAMDEVSVALEDYSVSTSDFESEVREVFEEELDNYNRTISGYISFEYYY